MLARLPEVGEGLAKSARMRRAQGDRGSLVAFALEIVELFEARLRHLEELARDGGFCARSGDQRAVATEARQRVAGRGASLGHEAGTPELGVMLAISLERAINEEQNAGHLPRNDSLERAVTNAESDPQSSVPPSIRELSRYRRAALGALAAELGHELQGPMNLFRLARERLARGAALEEEDLSLLDEELGRLGRLTSRLRTLAHGTLVLRPTAPRPLVDAALASPPLGLEDGLLELELETIPSVAITCDTELLARGVRELIDNALQARSRRAGVRFEAGATPGLCVWDDGAGLELEVERAMAWGVTTRPPAAGIGLTVALRAARVHGFTLELCRAGSRTEAWLRMPARALGATSSEAAP